MSIVILSKKATSQDLKKASLDYKTYVKITLDLEKEIVAVGGEYHADAEKLLLSQGSLQKNIWGGGLDIHTSEIQFTALINIKPTTNSSMDILDEKIRKKFLKLCKTILF